VSADKMGSSSNIQPDLQFQPPPGQNFAGAGGPASGGVRPGAAAGSVGGPQPQTGPIYIDDWFSLEPVGRIQLTMSFAKHAKNKQPFDLGLGRKGAIRQKKEEVHEQYGHKFMLQQFYNIMRCALCGEFLKYAAGMQCSDCKYTCHKKCYSKVVTKCITQSNAESDPDEAKLNHRIPHRFENFSNMGANWCCHCGYILPLGRKQSRKCNGMYPCTRLFSISADYSQNVVLLVTLVVCTLYPTSAGCQWRLPIKFLWRLNERGGDSQRQGRA
jgi:hypothetical protein